MGAQHSNNKEDKYGLDEAHTPRKRDSFDELEFSVSECVTTCSDTTSFSNLPSVPESESTIFGSEPLPNLSSPLELSISTTRTEKSSQSDFGYFEPEECVDYKKHMKRLQKWQNMHKDWDAFRRKKPQKVKLRVRKGIPEEFRGLTWAKLAGAGVKKEKFESVVPNYYKQLLRDKVDFQVLQQIQKDLPRTLPGAEQLHSREGAQRLRNVLRALAAHDPEVGYCQGMSFLAGMFLLHMDEEKAFFCIVSLLEDRKYAMRSVFLPGLPGVHERCFQFEQLLKLQCPKLHMVLSSNDISPQFYATTWFMEVLLFHHTDFGLTIKIWDCYLSEGLKIVFRVGLAVLKHHEAMLCSLGDACLLMESLKLLEIPSDILQKAFKIYLSRSQLEQAKKLYKSSEPSPLV